MASSKGRARKRFSILLSEMREAILTDPNLVEYVKSANNDVTAPLELRLSNLRNTVLNSTNTDIPNNRLDERENEAIELRLLSLDALEKKISPQPVRPHNACIKSIKAVDIMDYYAVPLLSYINKNIKMHGRRA